MIRASRSISGVILAWCVLAAACASVVLAGATGAGGASPKGRAAWDPAEAHAWIVATDGRPSVSVSVLHVPPRASTGSGSASGGVRDGAKGASEGTVRAAAALAEMPTGVAAIADEAFFAFEPRRGLIDRHRIVSVRSVATGVGSLWQTMPRGRMREHPQLIAPGRVVGLAGTGAGLFALTVHNDTPRLWTLGVDGASLGTDVNTSGGPRAGAWREVRLPDEATSARDPRTTPGGVVPQPAPVVDITATEASTSQPAPSQAATAPPPASQPTGRAAARAAVRASGGPWHDAPWRIVGGTRWVGVMAWTGGDSWTLWRLDLDAVTPLSPVATAPDAAPSEQAAAPSPSLAPSTDPLALAPWARLDVTLVGTPLAGLSAGPGGLTRLRFLAHGVDLVAAGQVEGTPRAITDQPAARDPGARRGQPEIPTGIDGVILSRRTDVVATWREIARVPDVALPGASFALATLEGVGRILVFWEAPREAPPSASQTDAAGNGTAARPASGRGLGPPLWRVAELSATSGEVFYTGQLRVPLATTSDDYRLLGLVLLGILAAAVVFIIAPLPRTEAHLPRGTALAPPGRRFLATMIDATLAAVGGSAIWGMSVLEALGPESLVTGRIIAVMATSLGIAVVVSAAMEATLGRSPGKLLMGIEVVRLARFVTPGPDQAEANRVRIEDLVVRPSIWMALVRTLIKWVLPPVALLGVLDPELRHRGDVLSRCAVVVRFDPDAPVSDDAE